MHLDTKSGSPVVAMYAVAVKEAQKPAVDDRISCRRQLSWLQFKGEPVLVADDTVVGSYTLLVEADWNEEAWPLAVEDS
jgi:hypothetical protein